MRYIASLKRYGCPHEPKIVRKFGIVADSQVLILVCKDCNDDPDLADFQELPMEVNNDDE